MNPFVLELYNRIKSGEKTNKIISEKIALKHGITDKNTIKELCELAIILRAREIARKSDIPHKDRYTQIVNLYKSQVNLSHRTSQSVMLQQYSTPAPIGFLCGIFVQQSGNNRLYFEPSAGNGLLTIGLPKTQVWVNEIDNVRSENLSYQGFPKQLRQDASSPFSDFSKKFDGIITNPPFGKLPEPIIIKGYRITQLDHLMVIYALDTMKDCGNAAFIIGDIQNMMIKDGYKLGKTGHF